MASIAEIRPGAKFRHYKNKDYEIITLAKDEATEKEMVVYRTLYGDCSAWVRAADSFCDMIEVNGKCMERFSFLEIKK